MSQGTLLQDLRAVINKHCAEGPSDTPDLILAEYLHRCLDNWTATTKLRDAWYGRPCGDGSAMRDARAKRFLAGRALSAAEQGGLC